MRDHPIAEPLAHRVQLPEQVPLRPGVAALARPLELAHQKGAVGGQLELELALGQVGQLRRQQIKAAEQVRRGCQLDAAGLRVLPDRVDLRVVIGQLLEGLDRELEIVGVEGARGGGRHLGLLGVAGELVRGQAGEEVEAVVVVVVVVSVARHRQVGDDLLGALARGDPLDDVGLLGLGVLEAEQRADIAEVLVGLVLLLDQALQHPQIAAELIVGGDREEVVDLRLAGLAVAVDPAVALLQGDQRPGDVEVDQAVAVVVEVDPLGGRVRGEEHPDSALAAAKVLDHRLLRGVVEAAREHADRARREV